MNVATAKQMQSLDRRTVAEYGLPSILLMENAAFGIVEKLFEFYPSLPRLYVGIFCGRGNNGGDGLAVARHLLRRGVAVEAALLFDPGLLKGEVRTNFEVFSKQHGAVRIADKASEASYIRSIIERSDLLIDAIFGTGLSQPITGHLALSVEEINRSGKPVVAVDIPSGISSDTGKVLGCAVRAERTLTLALPKRGHFLLPGLEHRGALSVVDIGIPPALVAEAKIPAELSEPSRFAPFLHARPRGAHKGAYGHLLIIAGSRGKGGAAAMAAHGALRSGVGLLTVAYPRELLLANLPMEAMTAPLPETSDGTLSSAALKPLLNGVQGKEAAALGPGLSQNPETQEIIRELIFDAPLPMVIDADGINALAGRTEGLRSAPGARVLTPHPGEMARLIGAATQKVLEDPMGEAERFATAHRVVLVLKGAQTIIAAPDGSLLINPTGNPGMATGGSGDILTGMIGAQLAQGVPPLEAAALSVYLHGLAGDLAASDRGETGMTPSDLIERIPGAFRTLQAGLKTSPSTKEYR